MIRSILSKTLFVLGRAIRVAAPAGIIIWILANVKINDFSLLTYCADFCDPLGRLMGLDGVILMAFILGFPANEIVIPIIIMTYLGGGNLMELKSITQLKALLIGNDWTMLTAICFMLFSLMHWPCSTTLLTIKKETQSMKWTVLSALLPTAIGIILCIAITAIIKLANIL